MFRKNNLYLLIRAMNRLEKQKIINSIGWKSKRSYLKRQKGFRYGKKNTQDLSKPIEIIYTCNTCPDLYLIGI